MKSNVIGMFMDKWFRVQLKSNKNPFEAKILEIINGDIILLKNGGSKSAVSSKEIVGIEEISIHKEE